MDSLACLRPLAATLLLVAIGDAAAGAVRTEAGAPDTLRFSRTVFASGRELPAPVAFSVDERCVVYTANSLRMAGHGLFDVRAYRGILADDWTLTSVAERRTATERWVRAGLLSRPGAPITLDSLASRSEQVRRLEDTDGDGRADTVAVFAGGMNELERGAAAGVLAMDGRVFASVIPELLAWEDSGGTARRRVVLQSGFGVHMGQSGHDLHGLTLGLDGRLYWSIGDRGYAFTTREGHKLSGQSGAVFRCWPDGSGLERYATGLRNPQELAFNDQGDLFTGDNNADVGDRSRLLYVPEGADAGWSYFLQFTHACGPWLREQEWEPEFPAGDPARPAWVLPPAAEAGSCPAGITAYPGTGLPARYDGTLWLADFVGGVSAYRMVPEGAGYRLGERLPGFHESWSTCDVEFAPDGRLFVLYWGESWEPGDQARLLALTPPAAGVDTARVREVRELLALGTAALDDSRLERLLEHPDRRVRQRASLELARRGRLDALARALRSAREPRARLHALWGLGALAHSRGDVSVRSHVIRALSQPDPEVRRVAACVLGELGDTTTTPVLAARLADASPRVRFAAAQALARTGDGRAHAGLLDFLARDGTDPLQRMAAARALASTSTPARLAALQTHADRVVRLGAVLALRESAAPEVATFLADADAQVACEAARAAYDLELSSACRSLVATLPGLRPELRIEPYVRRALHAALRVGSPEAASAVAEFAADSTTSAEWREEALRVLVQWDRPDPRDGVWGRWEPQPSRPAGMARAAEARELERLFQVSDGPALLLAVQIASDQHLRVSSSAFLRWVRDPELDDGLRVSSFHWLAARGGPESRLAEVAALSSASDTLFAAGLASILARDPVHGVAVAERTLARRRALTAVKQAALRVVSGSDSREARAFVKARWEELVAGRLPPELALEATEAARVTSDAAVRRVALASSSGAPSGVPFSLALNGGDAQRGRALFEEHEAAACLRCHTIDRRGGTTGPDLSVVGTHTRAYLLESLVEPGAHLAPGFESSPMPNMGGLLSLSQLRDLVEYLASRRDQAPDMPLGALSPETVAKGPGCVRVNRSCVGSGGLRVGGRSFVSGVSVASPSRLTYLIPSGFRAFVGSAGLDDAAGGRIVEFQAKLDGRLAWNSGPMRQGRLVRFCVPVPEGARRLELIVLDRSASAEASVADWIHVGFLY